jgi:hypothetical protein
LDGKTETRETKERTEIEDELPLPKPGTGADLAGPAKRSCTGRTAGSCMKETCLDSSASDANGGAIHVDVVSMDLESCAKR